MADKVTILYLDKKMREYAERLGIDKQTPEEAEQALLKASEDPDTQELVSKGLKLIINGDIQGFRKMWKDHLLKMEETGKFIIGCHNSGGVFICCVCLHKLDVDYVSENFSDDGLVCISDLIDLKPGSFYQCENCKEKFQPIPFKR